MTRRDRAECLAVAADDSERFAALVAHPYGFAAVSLANETAWAKLDYGKSPKWLAELHHIKFDIAAARARARGKA